VASSDKAGASASQIQTAITNDTGNMGQFSFLTADQIQAIANALSGQTTPPPGGGGSNEGTALYQQYCSGCHGDVANSSQAGASASQIQTAITNDTGNMGQFSFLTADQIQAIANALSGQTTPPPGGGGGNDGTALYQQYCSNCHGELNDSQVNGESANEIQAAISDDKGGMASLGFLSNEQISAIAAALDE
jgi:mono/diheme cytochrome c family protein